MIFNIPILLLWTAGMALMIWNMYGTLGHSCTTANWGNSDGVMICNQYKALFSFVIIAWLCQIALIVLDVRARRSQAALGKYDKMRESQEFNLKMDPLHNRDDSVHSLPLGAGFDGAAQRINQHEAQPLRREPSQQGPTRQDSFYSTAAPTYTTEPLQRQYSYEPQQHTQQSYHDTPYGGSTGYQSGQYQAYNPSSRFDPAYSAGGNMHSMNDFQYQAQAPAHTRYDNYYR
jgi:hypothetical protein